MNTTSTEPAVTVAMMLAMDKNKLIGKDGGMPWFIPGEQVYFKSVTMGKPILMGRVTYDSIGKPLPGRPNIVVTRNADWHADGVHVCTSLNQAIELATTLIEEANEADNPETVKAATVTDGSDSPSVVDSTIEHTANNELVIIGGAGLCREAMPQITRVYLTLIDHEYEGDVWLDSFDWDDWREHKRTDLEHEGLRYSYFVLERKPG